MKRLFSHSLKALLCLSIILCTVKALANSEHQFSLNLSQGQVDYLEGDASYTRLNASVYFSPLKKSDALPYSRTAFYSRTGSVSISASKTKWDDMQAVIGAKLLETGEAKNYSISTFLAHSDIPVWARVEYLYIDHSTWYFSDESKFESETDSVKAIALGAYLLDDLSMHGLFAKQDDKTYGMGLSKLFKLSSYGFIETRLAWSITKRKNEDEYVDIINNTVRNLNISAQPEKNRSIQLSYFPLPETRLSFSYQQIDYDKYDWNDRYYTYSLEHYLSDQINLTLSYTHKKTYFLDHFGEYNDYGLNLGFDF